MNVLSHSGRRVICLCLPLGPASAVFQAHASEGCKDGSFPETKSVKAGPALSYRQKWWGGLVVWELGCRPS